MAAIAVGALTAAGPAAANAQPGPSAPLKQSVAAGDWTFELHGPRTPRLQVEGHPTEIVVRHREVGVITLLQPLKYLSCTVGGAGGCVPIDLMGRTREAVKKTKMVVSDHDGHVPPEVSTTFWTGGMRCCYMTVGFWQPQDGPWQANRLNSGMTEPISDKSGRIRIGDRRWETLDWSPRVARPFLTWHKLMNGEGWKHASTRADVEAELKRTTRAVRSLQRQKGADAREAARSARGVRLGYLKALGRSKAVSEGRRSYRKMYGSAALKRLDSGLRRVETATRR